MHAPMRPLVPALTAALLATVLPAARPALAADSPVTLQNHDGKFAGTLMNAGKWPKPGTIIATRFRPEHKFRLESVELRFQGVTGRKVELHVWRDNGALEPGAPEGWYTNHAGADLIPPKKVWIQTIDAMQKVDLSSPGLVVPPVEPFWVGIRLLESGATMGVDAYEKGKNPITTMLQSQGGQCKDGCGVPHDLLVTVHGAYIDPLQARWFTDITAESGLKPGGRMAWADYDGDGDLDCLVSGSKLYVNDGKGGFAPAEKTGLEQLGGSKGLWADFDNDGVLDLAIFGAKEYIARGVPKADGSPSGRFEVFQELPEAADGTRYPTEAAVWVDIDNDGFIDLYTANYEKKLSVCFDDFLWRNDGGDKFIDVSDKYGVRAHGKQCGRGITAVDWDQDGDTDIFVGNYRLDPNFFFVNEYPDAGLTDIAADNGTIGEVVQGAYGHTIGPSFVDADSDGDFDLFVPNLAHPRFIAFSDRSFFYRNDGKAAQWGFSEHRKSTGITYQETNSDARFGDFDNDGLPDLALTNVYKGRIGRVWRNTGPKAGAWLGFEDVTYPSGILIDNGWGSAWVDIDGDGDLDYVANRLLRNDLEAAGQKVGHWLKVRLRGGGKVNRAALGAWVVARVGSRRITRHVSGGDGLSGQSGLVLHFGIGDAEQVDGLEIHWPGAEATMIDGPIQADRTIDFSAAPELPARGDGDEAEPDGGELDGGAIDGGAIDGGSLEGADHDSGIPKGGGAGEGGGCGVGRAAGAPSPAPWWLALIALGALAGRRRRSGADEDGAGARPSRGR